MKRNKIEKENVFKTFGWKPGDGDYSVKKEVKGKNSKNKSLNSYTEKLKSLIGIGKK